VFNLFIRQLDVVDNHVHALDIQARHALDGVDDVAADSLSQFVDGNTVFRDDGDLNGGHSFFYRDGDTLADVFIAAEGLTDGAYQAGAAATEGSNTRYFTRSDASDLGDNSIIDGGGTVLGFQVLIDLGWGVKRISGCTGGCFRNSLWDWGVVSVVVRHGSSLAFIGNLEKLSVRAFKTKANTIKPTQYCLTGSRTEETFNENRHKRYRNFSDEHK